jgi:hypothetical protein
MWTHISAYVIAVNNPHNCIDVVVVSNEEEYEDVDPVALYLRYYR